MFLNDAIAHQISARLSLRRPQAESLGLLADLLSAVELSKTPDLETLLASVRVQYPQVEDFERDFPSLCFALATGVGKTRLMGAFIAWLALSGRSKNFLVLSPNLTIYEKLIADFSPESPKYVFRGISRFANDAPIIVTGDTWDRGHGARTEADADRVFINIFNISKLNATENKKGATHSRVPRVKRLQETLGESYFDYLAALPDLVILMDEAHRYRASASAEAIKDLKPVLGLELTATPKTVGARQQPFKNVLYHYPLAAALQDGYIKEPAVATRKDFNAASIPPEELERIKLEDGVHHHEFVKVELATYCARNALAPVYPFMLVVAQDTTHAGTLRAWIESESFFDGRYKGKVIEIHSKLKGEESDENTLRLLAVEHDANTEIVIHVNKLKEGWDVRNLYTIVPLRASASEILTEQTIGRGLRLPFEKRTGAPSVDRLTIIAHDRFREIVDQANEPESIIRKTVEIGPGGEIPVGKPQVIEVRPGIDTVLTGRHSTIDGKVSEEPTSYAVSDQSERKIAAAAIQVLKRFEHLPDSESLRRPEVREQITKQVTERVNSGSDAGLQETLPGLNQPGRVEEIVATVTDKMVELTIDIPNIVLLPTREVTFGFNDFDLQNLSQVNEQPVSRELLVRHLRTHDQQYVSWDGEPVREARPENYVVGSLIERDDIDYDEYADLLYKLTGQLADHLRSYLRDEADVENVMCHHRRALAKFIYDQMQEEPNFWETPTDYRAKVTKGFSLLKPNHFSLPEGERPRPFRDPVRQPNQIKRMVFGGFEKCCYPLQKFDSYEGEWRLANLLESDHDVIRWMKPAAGHFRIEYRSGKPYEPDFVVETMDRKLLIEPKRRSEMGDEEVQAKARAAVRWRRYASEHAAKHGGKPWSYLLAPHDALGPERSLAGLIDEFAMTEP